jgi:2-polyprenyl-3-methyl-5-hydroxy-6-metoxy-1,4-benzoquinol methylase
MHQLPDIHAGNRQRVELVRNRETYLEELAARCRSVAHLGCTDSPYTLGRLETDRLLHARLVARTNVTGFDIDAEALEVLRARMPEQAFVLADLTHEVPDEHRGAFDLVLAGEVLEHLDNIGAFLRGCRELLEPDGVLCVTVPNACSPKIGIRAVLGRESTHPDHRVYFGPRTLRRTLEAAGFSVESVLTYLSTEASTFGRVFNVGLRMVHGAFKGPIGEGLIALARPSSPPAPSN